MTPSQIKGPSAAYGLSSLSPAWQNPLPVDFREFERGALRFLWLRHWREGVTGLLGSNVTSFRVGVARSASSSEKLRAGRPSVVRLVPAFALALSESLADGNGGLQAEIRGEILRQWVSGAAANCRTRHAERLAETIDRDFLRVTHLPELFLPCF